MRLGFAGLGLMGRPMAANLLRAWPALVVYNRSPEPRKALAALGASTVDRAADLFSACDCVFLMLANDIAVDEVLARGTSEFRDRVNGKLIVNMGTHAPVWSRALEADIIGAGGRFVEAPVSGSRGPAEAGALVAMLAGEPTAVEQVKPLLHPLCSQAVVTGSVPSAMACKMAVNLYLIASVAALAEATTLAQALGVDLAAFRHVIGSGPLGSDVARVKLAKMAAGDFAPQAAIEDVCKNAALVAGTAAAARVDAPILAQAKTQFDAVLASGGAQLDMAAVITALGGKAAPE